jgi:hypothetical protein
MHFREILSGYFLFSRFDWSIFVTQLVAKLMKETILEISSIFFLFSQLLHFSSILMLFIILFQDVTEYNRLFCWN